MQNKNGNTRSDNCCGSHDHPHAAHGAAGMGEQDYAGSAGAKVEQINEAAIRIAATVPVEGAVKDLV